MAASMVLYFLAANLTQKLTQVADAETYNSVGSALNLSVESLLERGYHFLEALDMWFFYPVGHSMSVQLGINLAMVALGGLLRHLRVRFQ